jgi:phosphoadenosine phosphosulfate reductase
MTSAEIAQANEELRDQSPLEIVRWAIDRAEGRAIVSTNFRPFEAVVLHLATQIQPDIPVLWVDHGYNKAATYRHAEDVKSLLGLKMRAYVPRLTAAHYEAVYGGVPEPTAENEERIKSFSTVMKLEPFQRGMRELAPKIWITGLRQVQNPNRAGLDVVSADDNFGSIKISPVFRWTDREMDAYCQAHGLPNEWDYFDPAKADEKRECGLHAAWGGAAVKE